MESENVYSNQDQLENIIVENWPLKGFSQKEITDKFYYCVIKSTPTDSKPLHNLIICELRKYQVMMMH